METLFCEPTLSLQTAVPDEIEGSSGNCARNGRRENHLRQPRPFDDIDLFDDHRLLRTKMKSRGIVHPPRDFNEGTIFRFVGLHHRASIGR